MAHLPHRLNTADKTGTDYSQSFFKDIRTAVSLFATWIIGNIIIRQSYYSQPIRFVHFNLSEYSFELTENLAQSKF